MSFVSLDSILDRLQSQEKWAQERLWRKIFRYWSQAVGDLVAPHTRPTGLQRRVLQVAVSSPVWAQTLSFQRRSILQKLNQLIEEDIIVDIHFSTARWEKMNSDRKITKALMPPDNIIPTTPQEALDRCRSVVQQHKNKHRCPHCGAPAAAWEIARWRLCQHCAVQLFFAHR